MAFKISTHPFGKFAIAGISGRITSENEYDLQDHLNKIAAKSPHLALDLSEVTNITTHAVGIIVRLWKRLANANGTLDLIVDNPSLMEKCQGCNLHKIIMIYDSEQKFRMDAIKRAGKEPATVIRQKGRYQILDVREPLNIMAGYKELNKSLASLFDKGHRFIALNFSDIDHIYSEAIGIILKWHKSLETSKGTLLLLNLKPDLTERLKYLDIKKELHFCDSEQEI